MPRKPRTQRDPLLDAVIAKLPAHDAGFPAAQREAWMTLLRHALDMAYGAERVPVQAETTHGRQMQVDIHRQSSATGGPIFHVDAEGFARSPDGREIVAQDVPRGETLWDLRSSGAGDLSTVVWANGTWPAAALAGLVNLRADDQRQRAEDK
jgi:hypothetical protein